MLTLQVMDTTLAESINRLHENHVSTVYPIITKVLLWLHHYRHSDTAGRDFFNKNKQLKRPMSPHISIYR